MAAGRSAGVPIVVDPKGRDYSIYRGVDLLTPNREEAEAAVVEQFRSVDGGEDIFEDFPKAYRERLVRQEALVAASRRMVLGDAGDAVGSTVCAMEGSVWITEENQPRDIVLERGACYQVRNAGITLVNALSGEASVSLA